MEMCETIKSKGYTPIACSLQEVPHYWFEFCILKMCIRDRYQSEINVQFSRFASFIEVGGRTGLGYRDTAQDAMTVLHSNPARCKELSLIHI